MRESNWMNDLQIEQIRDDLRSLLKTDVNANEAGQGTATNCTWKLDRCAICYDRQQGGSRVNHASSANLQLDTATG